MSRYKITAPNLAYDGKVGDVQFSHGVYEGDVPDSILGYCRATGYVVEEIGSEPVSDGGGSAEPKAVADMTVAELKAEIDTRNADRDDEHQLDKPTKKDDLIAVLEADDADTQDGGGSADENGASQ